MRLPIGHAATFAAPFVLYSLAVNQFTGVVAIGNDFNAPWTRGLREKPFLPSDSRKSSPSSETKGAQSGVSPTEKNGETGKVAEWQSSRDLVIRRARDDRKEKEAPKDPRGGRKTKEGGDHEKRRPGEKFRHEYKPSPFHVASFDLAFELDEENTKVHSKIVASRKEGTDRADLVLDGEDLTLVSLSIDGKELEEIEAPPPSEADDAEKEGFYHLENGGLVIRKLSLPSEALKDFELKATVTIHPKANLKLSGLYVSGRALVTQCEAEGFRRITYYMDRPDILTKYTVRLEADKSKYPVLLSNGNKLEEGNLTDSPGRHYAIFEDPFPKPSYLFAILAADFSSISGTFTTQSGKEVAINVYSEPSQVRKLGWALESVKTSMRWDEEAFGREYDLDVFNVGCVSDFNAGAMENKGLNIFNCSLLLADPQTTTDSEYERILSVVGHEYFHNWTGDRVTVRDWFQLTLKEGLTVFREQMFMATVASAPVQRIQYVSALISTQFAEDESPMAHPIRPESYVAMDNFYTTTVYEKGAEVVRMYRTLLGPEGFRKGMDLYFQRHDGQAVTCDDFRSAMADANGVNFDQFERWYFQAGTPRLEVLQSRYNEADKSFEISLRQHTPPTPGQESKLPQVIPIRLGLIGKTSKRDILQRDVILVMTEERETFKVENVQEDCVPSLLRDFSAPVKLIFPQQTLEEMAFLMAFDNDPFNKWQASQSLASRIILSRASIAANKEHAEFEPLPESYVHGLREMLNREGTDNALKALTLSLPDWDVLARELKPINPSALHKAKRSVALDVAEALKEEMLKLYKQLTLPEGSTDLLTPEDISRRRLRNILLRFLSERRDKEAAERAFEHFNKAGSMTDKHAALIVLANMQCEERERAFSRFYDDSKGDALVIDKWFKAQAISDLPDQVERVAALLQHPAFSFTNPNRMRSLAFVFATANKVHFHRIDGKGYEFLADVVLKVDKFNPMAASRGAKLFMEWRDYDSERQKLMIHQLQRIVDEPTLSRNVREVASKALASAPGRA